MAGMLGVLAAGGVKGYTDAVNKDTENQAELDMDKARAEIEAQMEQRRHERDRGELLADHKTSRSETLADRADERGYQKGVRQEGYTHAENMQDRTFGHADASQQAGFEHSDSTLEKTQDFTSSEADKTRSAAGLREERATLTAQANVYRDLFNKSTDDIKALRVTLQTEPDNQQANMQLMTALERQKNAEKMMNAIAEELSSIGKGGKKKADRSRSKFDPAMLDSIIGQQDFGVRKSDKNPLIQEK